VNNAGLVSFGHRSEIFVFISIWEIWWIWESNWLGFFIKKNLMSINNGSVLCRLMYRICIRLAPFFSLRIGRISSLLQFYGAFTRPQGKWRYILHRLSFYERGASWCALTTWVLRDVTGMPIRTVWRHWYACTNWWRHWYASTNWWRHWYAYTNWWRHWYADHKI